jgi:hypothetical protein
LLPRARLGFTAGRAASDPDLGERELVQLVRGGVVGRERRDGAARDERTRLPGVDPRGQISVRAKVEKWKTPSTASAPITPSTASPRSSESTRPSKSARLRSSTPFAGISGPLRSSIGRGTTMAKAETVVERGTRAEPRASTA